MIYEYGLYSKIAIDRFIETYKENFNHFSSRDHADLLKIHSEILGISVSRILDASHKSSGLVQKWRSSSRSPKIETLHDINRALNFYYQNAAA